MAPFYLLKLRLLNSASNLSYFTSDVSHSKSPSAFRSMNGDNIDATSMLYI